MVVPDDDVAAWTSMRVGSKSMDDAVKETSGRPRVAGREHRPRAPGNAHPVAAGG
jgi:hypothetical protein